MEIKPSARRHGVRDEDMRHAVLMNIDVFWQENGVRVFVGPSRSGHVLLEVGVIEEEGLECIIHAMTARPKFLR